VNPPSKRWSTYECADRDLRPQQRRSDSQIGFGTWLLEQNAELDFEISAADMGDLDAMRDTDKHQDAMEFRWS
jgi:hypothetical protein